MLVELGTRWQDASTLDRAMQRFCVSVAGLGGASVEIKVPSGARMLIDGVVRLLAYANQMAGRGIAVRLAFEEGHAGAMGYLDRMGFFDHLSAAVEVEPNRPTLSGASVFNGNNPGLMEICAIRQGMDLHDLVHKLEGTIDATCGARRDFAEFKGAMSTILAELIENVYLHGGAGATGHAAFQSYQGASKARVVVSDDGHGLMQTIRPALEARDPAYGVVEDVDLLVAMFRDGLSRFDDPGHGNGLKGCATKAVRYKAVLDVRLRTQSIRLLPSGSAYLPSKAVLSTGLAAMSGTHIGFELSLV